MKTKSVMLYGMSQEDWTNFKVACWIKGEKSISATLIRLIKEFTESTGAKPESIGENNPS